MPDVVERRLTKLEVQGSNPGWDDQWLADVETAVKAWFHATHIAY